VGANWGDEGKGKMVDVLAAQADLVVRFQGGSNAGHTIINDYGKFALHLLPSGVFYPHVINVIGPGVAVNLATLSAELTALVERGVPQPQLVISDRAQVILPYHRLLDQYEEERLGAQSYGSTKQGIAPFYADKYRKVGLQLGDLADEERVVARIEQALAPKNVLMRELYGKAAVSVDEVLTELYQTAEPLLPLLGKTTELLHESLHAGKQILLEGQLGALRDPDHGIYPYPTSSSPLAGFAPVGAGIPPYAITEIVAVTKAYSSCVGAGPFVTELFAEEAEALRRRGGDSGEYGATTGRPRRVGWFDAVATRYGCLVQGATAVALTNLDVLGYLAEIPVCTSYRIDGMATTSFPTTGPLMRAQPCYTAVPGWQCAISDCRRFDELPTNAQRYVDQVEALLGVPVRYISVGPRREALIERS
ncbi:MAG: adenylosuccinate synthase, partial [Caldilineaceae bacterium]|nr:adenylosuccinate synthase [Caldilineaceae bacterium]